MARLIAKTPADGLLPVAVGPWTVSEVVPEAMTWIAPFRGQEDKASAALKKARGVPFPEPGRSHASGDTRIIWFGRGQAMLLGPALSELPGAAVADQSDGLAVLELQGPRLDDVLARLVPVDLRLSVFAEGATAQTLLGHMSVSIRRTGAARVEIVAFRSMVRTAVHEIVEAMRSVAAQAAL